MQISKVIETKEAWYEYLNRMFEVNGVKADSVKVWQMVDHLWRLAKGKGAV